MNTQPSNWSFYLPDYHSSKGWEVEKLQAEITARGELNKRQNDRLPSLRGTMEFLKVCDKIQSNVEKIYLLNERVYEICREAIGG